MCSLTLAFVDLVRQDYVYLSDIQTINRLPHPARLQSKAIQGHGLDWTHGHYVTSLNHNKNRRIVTP